MNHTGIWNIRRKVAPKRMKTLPTAKYNPLGRLVTESEELKQLYLDHFKHRLRHRPIMEGLENLQVLKENLCMK